MRSASATRHSPATMILHWTSALAIVLAVAAIYYRDVTDDRSLRILLMTWHRQLGLFVLIALVLRLAARHFFGFANQTSRMTGLMRGAAATTHLALYALLIALPILGLAATSAKGISLRLFGLVPLPDLTAADPDVADTLLNYHMWAAWVLFALVAVHAGAALWHHLIVRDGVLRAMWPRTAAPGERKRRAGTNLTAQ
jgi:cytochrome b561